MKRTKLQSYKPLRRRTQLRPRSKRTQRKYTEERIPLVKRILEERPWCEACAKLANHDGRTFYRVRPSVDVHEIASRGSTGGVVSTEWLDPDNCLALCRTCHRRITEDPDREAMRSMGLIA